MKSPTKRSRIPQRKNGLRTLGNSKPKRNVASRKFQCLVTQAWGIGGNALNLDHKWRMIRRPLKRIVSQPLPGLAFRRIGTRDSVATNRGKPCKACGIQILASPMK